MTLRYGGPGWEVVDLPDPLVGRERRALGTTARVALWPPESLSLGLCAVDEVLAAIDAAASRFRMDSELSQLNSRSGFPMRVGPVLAEALDIALQAAVWTDGMVDPTVGDAVIAAGYDRDIELIAGTPSAGTPSAGTPSAGTPSAGMPSAGMPSAGMPSTGTPSGENRFSQVRPCQGWRAISKIGQLVTVPAGVTLDLGATAKAFAADRAADVVSKNCRGVLVSLGGDIAIRGEAPPGGWIVRVAEDHTSTASASDDLVSVAAGGLATSSTTCRRWVHRGEEFNHIIDPRSGDVVRGRWRTATVVAASCVIANAAATAALVASDEALAWLERKGLSARLVDTSASVTRLGDWPAPRKEILFPGSEDKVALMTGGH